MSSCYDLIIVGAGPAGLRIGIETLKKHPTLRCCILEKYNYVGGRVVTYRKKLPSVGDVQWENGAGRISKQHRRVRELIHRYGLHFAPIEGNTSFLSKETKKLSPNLFYQLHSMYFDPLRGLSKDILASHTLNQLLCKTIGTQKTAELIQQFPYYSELHVLRADLALDAFDEEMGSNAGFGVCVEGYQAITDHMMKDFLSRGGILVKNTEVTEVRSMPDQSIQVLAKEKNCIKGRPSLSRVFHSTRVVLALHQTALQTIRGVYFPALGHLEMPPLLRIYAVYPKEKGHVWFEGLPKIVTDSRLRYIIPYNVEKGIIMISYTEGPDAEFWMKMSSSELERRISSELRSLFPDRSIPEPLFLKTHAWTDGCTYWKPGRYDVVQESKRSLQPMKEKIPNLFVCSESFSLHQSWVESALEQADCLLELPAFAQALSTN
jgi:hypothetical protein